MGRPSTEYYLFDLFGANTGNHSIKEIAKITGVSEGTIRSAEIRKCVIQHTWYVSKEPTFTFPSKKTHHNPLLAKQTRRYKPFQIMREDEAIIYDEDLMINCCLPPVAQPHFYQ